ncbi:MAG TPA: hypothetical protein VGR46_09630 [Candidatus Limnocylindria bacterium]|jgi:hypothetical protein|nr:hypothetical protein [Candidatus Limnocylindria bacterium]
MRRLIVALALVASVVFPHTAAAVGLTATSAVGFSASSADLLGAVSNDSAPVIDGVSFAPNVPRTNDLLQANVVAHDPDGNSVALIYEWSRNGTVIAGATSSALYLSTSGVGDRGDTITVKVTASDGELTATASASVVVADSPPTVTVALSDPSLTTNALLTATATASDPDGDRLAYTFRWQVNGVTVETATGPNPADGFDLSLTGNGDRGDTITVQVTASDGTLESAPASASAVVMNSAPVVSATLSDGTPGNDVLVATAIAEDPDGDPLTLTYVWRINGNVARTTTTAQSTDSLDLKGQVASGDVVTLTLTATDGTATSVPATARSTVTMSDNDD